MTMPRKGSRSSRSRSPVTNQPCPTVDRGLEELVILGIARRTNGLNDVDDFDERRDALEECIASRASHVAIELRQQECFDQLPQCIGCRHELCATDGFLESEGRR